MTFSNKKPKKAKNEFGTLKRSYPISKQVSVSILGRVVLIKLQSKILKDLSLSMELRFVTY